MSDYDLRPSASISYPPGATEAEKARMDRVMKVADKIHIPYGYDLAHFLMALLERIDTLEAERKGVNGSQS